MSQGSRAFGLSFSTGNQWGKAVVTWEKLPQMPETTAFAPIHFVDIAHNQEYN